MKKEIIIAIVVCILGVILLGWYQPSLIFSSDQMYVEEK